MFLHFPIYFNYTSLQFFLQIEGFGTVQFLHRRVAMQEGKALCKAPPFIKNEWLACHFFQKLLPSSQTPRAFQAKKWVRNASVPLRKAESFFCQLHLKNLVKIYYFNWSKNNLFKHKKLKDRWKKNLFFCNLTNILQFIKSNKKNLQKIKNYYWRFKEVKVQYY